eukprot:scaffold272060_cov28-Tisochrysis_lutea.AAC.1
MHHHVGVDYLSRLTEVVLERLPGGLPRQVAHVHTGPRDHLVNRRSPRGRKSAAAVPGHGCHLAGAGRGESSNGILSILAHEDVAPVELGLAQCGDCVGCLCRRLEGDDPAALGAPIVHHHVGMDHLSRLAEVVLERLPSRLPRQVAHVHACARRAAADTPAGAPPSA